MRRFTRSRTVPIAVLAAVLLGAAGCSGASGKTRSLTLYTCATANVEQAVVNGFEKAHSGVQVNVFRAPTGQLNARIAADARSGGIKADVIWACDPLTMHGYDAQGLLAQWTPPNSADIPSRYRTAHFTGVAVLYLVAVVHAGTPAPHAWSDLTTPRYRGRVVLPDPGFAASALGALGYFATAPGYGLDFYQRLKANGAKQVNAPGDALTGVEQGAYAAGLTLANQAYADKKKGSPIDVAWPAPGGVAIYGPIGVTTRHQRSALAEQFADFAAGRDGQTLMARAGTYVTLPGVAGPPIPPGSQAVAPDWTALFATYKDVLAKYTRIFG